MGEKPVPFVIGILVGEPVEVLWGKMSLLGSDTKVSCTN